MKPSNRFVISGLISRRRLDGKCHGANSFKTDRQMSETVLADEKALSLRKESP